MKLSIITVCWNAADTIERTIRSVLGQKCNREDFEYIIVDGQSNDGTLEIIDKYKDDIDCFVSESDEGIYDAMNKSLGLVNGEYVAFMNADDYYEAKAFSKVIEAIEESNKADIIYGNTVCHYKNGEEHLVENRSADYIWQDMIACHQAIFVKKSLFDENDIGKFDTKYKIAADYDFFQKAYIRKKRFYRANDIYCHYFLGGESEKQLRTYYEDYADIMKKNSGYCPNGDAFLKKWKQRVELAIFSRVLEEDNSIIVDFVSADSDKQIVIWGTGVWGNKITKYLNYNGVCVSAYIDSFTEGKKIFNNVKLISLTDVIDYISNNEQVEIIVAVCNKKNEIEDTINKLKIPQSVPVKYIDDWITKVASKEIKWD